MNLTAPNDHAGITALINKVPSLARSDLIDRWQKHFGNPPGKMISTRLLVLAIAYGLQVERQGGLSRRSRNELIRLSGVPVRSPESRPEGDALPAVGKRKAARPGAPPRHGTRFVREWNGKSHVVEVLEKGFAWQGKTYRSLSAIATAITGSRWSGPRFFGLVS
jgi:hypothetical protein